MITRYKQNNSGSLFMVVCRRIKVLNPEAPDYVPLVFPCPKIEQKCIIYHSSRLAVFLILDAKNAKSEELLNCQQIMFKRFLQFRLF
jgi:hypothetical protein